MPSDFPLPPPCPSHTDCAASETVTKARPLNKTQRARMSNCNPVYPDDCGLRRRSATLMKAAFEAWYSGHMGGGPSLRCCLARGTSTHGLHTRQLMISLCCVRCGRTPLVSVVGLIEYDDTTSGPVMLSSSWSQAELCVCLGGYCSGYLLRYLT